MIYYFVPYATNWKLGEAYNNYCKIVPNSEDWICFMDGDVMLFSEFGRQVEHVIENHRYDLYTCFATRVGTRVQQLHQEISDEKDLASLKRKCDECEKQAWGRVTEIKQPISGHFMLFQKALWEQFPFPVITKEGPLLGIDKQWSFNLLENGKTPRNSGSP